MRHAFLDRARPYPFGLTRQAGVGPTIPAPANMAVYAPAGEKWVVHVLHPDGRRTRHPLNNRQYDVHFGIIPDVVDGTRYALSRADSEELILDPYAPAVVESNGEYWGSYVEHSFDWRRDTRLGTPKRKTVIYEAHVKGLTKLHPDIPERLRGTYAGLAHPVMLDYLLELGVTAVQLLPVHHSIDEPHLVENGLTNYWGYNTLNYFSPDPGYATEAARKAGPSAIAVEFKEMVRSLHAAGLEVYLDVVYNHTAEGGQDQETYSWRALGDDVYYVKDQDGNYVNSTGTGNTVNFAHPRVVQWAMDSLRHWVSEFHIDGFRFDLAVTMGRDSKHRFNPRHPFFVAVTQDPVLAGVKMIAEPWDLGPGGWQTGNFPPGWSDWNDHFRDTMRDFWVADRGRIDSGATGGDLGRLAQALSGSNDIFNASFRGPFAPVNFVTAHDGFTLKDLVSYNYKHNELNKEHNRDGADYSRSYNHGVEGPSEDPDVWGQRLKTAKNLMSALLISSGIPMICAGDEVLRTQRGNNNAYSQDNEISWLDWSARTEQQEQMFQLTRHLIQLRKTLLEGTLQLEDQTELHKIFNQRWFNAHGEEMSQEDWWDTQRRTMQLMMSGELDSTVLVVFNGSPDRQLITVPVCAMAPGNSYRLVASTSKHGDQRRGAVITAGKRESIEPFSTAIFRCEG
ncbi:glycogen debranching protein GlgX [Micrococcoides hystricis]|uniref:Glycogen debranching protein GlgX n=1 Tax=Micrococcoides hystricis TaxID=1572761 RepID=A0ABV6PBT4_9MICC